MKAGKEERANHGSSARQNAPTSNRACTQGVRRTAAVEVCVPCCSPLEPRRREGRERPLNLELGWASAEGREGGRFSQRQTAAAVSNGGAPHNMGVSHVVSRR